MTKNSGLHDFAFDRVFGERSGQPQVYEAAARRLVMEFLNGTSASIICCLIPSSKNPIHILQLWDLSKRNPFCSAVSTVYIQGMMVSPAKWPMQKN